MRAGLPLRFVRHRLTRRQSLGLAAVFLAIAALEYFLPLGGVPTQQAFFGFLIAIGTAIFHAVHFVADATLAGLIFVVNALRQGAWLLGRALKTGLFETGRGIAKVLRTAGNFFTDTLPRFFKWAYKKIQLFESWLKDTFAPVFRFLKRIRDELDDIYKRFVRPVLDTIDFIRALNRVLLTFHIHLLEKLDRTLADIERRIEEPLLWLYARLATVENWVNRIVTADGLFQRLTLITSLNSYAPAWIRTWWNSQIKPLTTQERTALFTASAPAKLQDYVNATREYVDDGGGVMAARIREMEAQLDLNIRNAR